jgi:hypothetical protein
MIVAEGPDIESRRRVALTVTGEYEAWTAQTGKVTRVWFGKTSIGTVGAKTSCGSEDSRARDNFMGCGGSMVSCNLVCLLTRAVARSSVKRICGGDEAPTLGVHALCPARTWLEKAAQPAKRNRAAFGRRIVVRIHRSVFGVSLVRWYLVLRRG